MQQTSIISYYQEKESGNIGRMQAIILEEFRLMPDSTDLEIAKRLGFTENQVRPRRRELVIKGIICNVGTRNCTVSGKKAIVWRRKCQS